MGQLLLQPVHFWTLADVRELSEWDPDHEPARFADGRGHWLFELFVRLARRGAPVSIGKRAGGQARLLVTTLQDLEGEFGRISPRKVALLALETMRCRCGVIVIRSDRPEFVKAPGFVQCEVVPNPSAVVDTKRQRWLPPLPQRGLIPRDPGRGSLVEVMALKSFSFNLPSFVGDRQFADALKGLGVTLRVDCEPARWADFSDCDLALCVRRYDPQWDTEGFPRKPPTKLINAWVAGAIPLIGPERGYLDLARVGADALLVHTPEDILEAVRRLRHSAELAEALRRAGAGRAREFGVECVLDRWQELLSMDPEPRQVRAAAAFVWSGARCAGRRITRAVARLVSA